VVGTVTAVVVTYPLCFRLGSAVLEDGTLDGYQFMWNLWWVRESLLHLHQNPFFTTYLFHPDGVPLLFHTFCFSLGLASVPLQLALPGGVLTTYNVLVIAAPALTMLGVTLLAHEVTGDRWAALAGGFAAAVTGAAVWNLPDLYLDCTYTIAFALWAWWRLHRRARPRDVALALVLLLVVVFASQEYALMTLVVVAADTAASVVVPRLAGLPPRWAGGLVAFWALAAAALGALAVAALMAPAVPPPATMILFNSAYAAALVVPAWLVPPPGPVWRVMYLGTAALALVPVALVCDRRRATFWVVLAVLLASMALGPEMHWTFVPPDARWHGVPGPYAVVLRVLPLFRFFRAPYRWIVAVHVLLGVVVAVAVAGLRARIARAGARRLVTAALLALVVAGAAVDSTGLRPPLVDTGVPRAYRLLTADPEPSAVVELPAGPRTDGFAVFSSLYMYYQTAHRKYLLDGTVARLPRDRRLVVQRPIADVLALPYVKYVVVHRDLLAQASDTAQRQVEAADRLLATGGDLAAHDGAIEVYRLRSFRPETVRAP
jgi:hypothetical protein